MLGGCERVVGGLAEEALAIRVCLSAELRPVLVPHPSAGAATSSQPRRENALDSEDWKFVFIGSRILSSLGWCNYLISKRAVARLCFAILGILDLGVAVHQSRKWDCPTSTKFLCNLNDIIYLLISR